MRRTVLLRTIQENDIEIPDSITTKEELENYLEKQLKSNHVKGAHICNWEYRLKEGWNQ